jgi:multiple sugar transport system permease protein
MRLLFASRLSLARLSLTQRRDLEGYLLISPWLVGFFLLTLGPAIFSIVMSFTNWDIVRAPTYAGLDNFVYAFAKDRLLRTSVYNTLYYVALSVPSSLILALFLALLLNQEIPGIGLWRTVFYLPAVVSLVAMAIVWVWIFQPRVGVLNYLLNLWFGIDAPSWLGDPDWTKPALVLVGLMYVGPQMIIFLAGLKGIPQTLYESAELDGAGPITRFRRITLPMLSSVTFYNLVTSVIHAFQVFALVYVIFTGQNQGSGHGPLNSTLVYSLYIYEQAFLQLHMGYASALAWMLFLVVLAITLLQLRFSGWVYYERGA